MAAKRRMYGLQSTPPYPHPPVCVDEQQASRKAMQSVQISRRERATSPLYGSAVFCGPVDADPLQREQALARGKQKREETRED
jgi:hypothetical protein